MMASTKKRSNNLRRQVRRDVRQAYKPVLQSINKQKEIAAEERDWDAKRAGNIYGNLTETFAPLNDQFTNASKQILAGAQGALGGLGGEGMEPGMQELLATMGQGHTANLATGMQGTLGNIAGLQAGALANRADTEANVMKRYRDFVNELSLTRFDTKAKMAEKFLEQLQLAKDNRVARREQKMREEAWKLDKKDRRTGNRQDRQDRQDARDQKEFILNLAQREFLEEEKKKWRKNIGVPQLRNDIAATQAEIRKLQELGIPEMGPQINSLQNELQEMREKLGRKRTKVKKKAQRYKQKVGA